MKDAAAVAWKEWRELLGQRGLRGKQGVVLFVAVFGVVLPLMNGPAWVVSPLSLVAWSWVPMMLVTTVIADAFAGERERHTLETLLASRLSERAILFGKMGAAVGYAGAVTAASALLGLVAVNVAHGRDGLLVYPGSAVVAMGVLGLLGAVFVAALGILLSLRAATVKQAQQTLASAIMIVFLAPVLAIRLMPGAWPDGVVTGAAGGALLAIAGTAALTGLDALVIWLTLLRFKRSRLVVV